MKIKLPPNEAILYALGIAQTLGMAQASYSYAIDADLLGRILAISRGLLTGFAVSFALAILAQGLARVWQTKRRRYLALISGAALLLIVPVYMAPAAFLDMAHIAPHELRVVAAICISLTPDVAAIVVAALSGALQVVEQPKTIDEARPATPRKAKSKLRKPVTNAALIAELRRAPGATDDQIADIFGVSRQAIQQRRKKLTPADLGLAARTGGGSEA
jgi:hypothetical protein